MHCRDVLPAPVHSHAVVQHVLAFMLSVLTDQVCCSCHGINVIIALIRVTLL